MRKNIVVSGVAILVLMIVASGVWWLFSTGRLIYIANPSQSGDKTITCDDSIVDRYNEASVYTVKGNDATPTYDKEGLAKLSTEIQAKNEYASDPTCQTILFYVAVRNSNYENAKASYEALLDLHKLGKYANSNIRSNEPLFNYPDYVNALSGEPAQEE